PGRAGRRRRHHGRGRHLLRRARGRARAPGPRRPGRRRAPRRGRRRAGRDPAGRAGRRAGRRRGGGAGRREALMTYTFDPLVPRPIDRPTEVAVGPLTAEQSVALDDAKIFAGPADPADREAWRETLRAWRADARDRHGYTGAAYERPEAAWAAGCSTVAQVWLWDELLYSFEEHRFT